MAATQPRKGKHFITLEAFLTIPEVEPALEYSEGVVKQKMAPLGEHSVLQTELTETFNRLLRPSEIGRAFTELRTTFGGRSYVPDVSVYRHERIPRTPTGRVATRFTTPPDVAIEIRSPGQSVRDLANRCRWYVDNGVQVALLVDDRTETIHVFRPGAPPKISRGNDRIELPELGDGIAIVPAEVFAALTIPSPGTGRRTSRSTGDR